MFLLHALGALLGWLAGSVLRSRRAHVERAMGAAGVGNPRLQARAMYRALGISAMEFLYLAARGDRAIERVRIDGASLPEWRKALGGGRGVVVAASHTGNWDLAACAVARDVELLVVTKRLSMRALDRFWQSTRAARGVHLADAKGAMGRAREVLRRAGAVAMMIDQVPGSARHANELEFLGRLALVDRAPAALAASAGAPLVVAASLRTEDGGHQLFVLDVVHPPPRPTRAWIDFATATATLALDRFVRDNPSQWLWLHRRWKRLDGQAGAGTLAEPCKTRSSSPAEASRAA